MIIYALWLRNGKYYVGQTWNIRRRLGDHFSGNGSVWTTMHPPISVLYTVRSNSKFDEDRYTLELMDKYGMTNVRGGSFCTATLGNEDKIILGKMLRNANSECFRCGEVGHSITNCVSGSVACSDVEIDNLHLLSWDKKLSEIPIVPKLGTGTEIYSTMSKDLYSVALVGEFLSGKSTVVNALAGKKIVNTGVSNNTNYITCVGSRNMYEAAKFVESSIVTDDGYPIVMADLAGFSKDTTKLLMDVITESDLVLFTVDSSYGIVPSVKKNMDMVRQLIRKANCDGDVYVQFGILLTKCTTKINEHGDDLDNSVVFQVIEYGKREKFPVIPFNAKGKLLSGNSSHMSLSMDMDLMDEFVTNTSFNLGVFFGNYADRLNNLQGFRINKMCYSICQELEEISMSKKTAIRTRMKDVVNSKINSTAKLIVQTNEKMHSIVENALREIIEHATGSNLFVWANYLMILKGFCNLARVDTMRIENNQELEPKSIYYTIMWGRDALETQIHAYKDLRDAIYEPQGINESFFDVTRDSKVIKRQVFNQYYFSDNDSEIDPIDMCVNAPRLVEIDMKLYHDPIVGAQNEMVDEVRRIRRKMYGHENVDVRTICSLRESGSIQSVFIPIAEWGTLFETEQLEWLEHENVSRSLLPCAPWSKNGHLVKE